MSDDTPQTPEPDPFEQLLRGLSEGDDGAGRAEATPAVPSDTADLPPTVALPRLTESDLPEPAPAPPPRPASPSSPGWSLGDSPIPTAETMLYPAAGATAATTVLPSGDAPPPSRPGGPTRGGGPFGGRPWLLWVLIGAAALLVIALAVLITALAMQPRNEPGPVDTPTASDTPSPTDSVTPSDTPTPEPTVVPAIESFLADPMVVRCPDPSSVVTVQLGWSTVGATEVAVASAAALVDAIDKPYQNNLGPVVEQFAIPYACGNPEWTYTLTIVGTDGEHRSSIVTVTRLPFPTPTPTPTPAPSISGFSADPATVSCADGEPDPTFGLEWASKHGTAAAIDGPGADTGYDWPSLAASGHQPNISYDCSVETMTFTLTVTGPSAPPATATVTVRRDATGADASTEGETGAG